MNLDKKTAKRLILLCAVVLVIAMLCNRKEFYNLCTNEDIVHINSHAKEAL